MQSQFIDHGTAVTYNYIDPSRVSSKLKPAIYELEISDTPSGPVPQLTLRGDLYPSPPIRYGDHTARLKIVQENYNPAGPSMGVLLVGVKGSGKSLFAEDLGNWLVSERRLPVVMVMTQIPVSFIRKAIQAIGPCMVYFDEFGKTYDQSKLRDKMIALFSDSDLRGALFLVTANGYDELADPMINRPGRFKYRINFDGLSPQAVLEVAAHHQLNEELTVGLMRYAMLERSGYDTLDSVAGLIRNCVSDEQARQTLAIINVPGWGQSGVTISCLKEGDRRLIFDKAHYDGSVLTVTALEGERHDIERIISIGLIESREWYETGEEQVYKSGDFTLTFRPTPTQLSHFALTGALNDNTRAYVTYLNRKDHATRKSTSEGRYGLDDALKQFEQASRGIEI